jgi:hypothetical protein
MTMQFPVDSFERFQKELSELTAGKVRVEVIESKETVVPGKEIDW